MNASAPSKDLAKYCIRKGKKEGLFFINPVPVTANLNYKLQKTYRGWLQINCTLGTQLDLLPNKHAQNWDVCFAVWECAYRQKKKKIKDK